MTSLGPEHKDASEPNSGYRPIVPNPDKWLGEFLSRPFGDPRGSAAINDPVLLQALQDNRVTVEQVIEIAEALMATIPTFGETVLETMKFRAELARHMEPISKDRDDPLSSIAQSIVDVTQLTVSKLTEYQSAGYKSTSRVLIELAEAQRKFHVTLAEAGLRQR